MTLNTKGFGSTQPGMVRIITPLGSMAADTGHGLTGPRVEDGIPNGMGEYAMLTVTLAADFGNTSLHHGRMIGPVRRMAVVAGVGHRVFEFR